MHTDEERQDWNVVSVGDMSIDSGKTIEKTFSFLIRANPRKSVVCFIRSIGVKFSSRETKGAAPLSAGAAPFVLAREGLWCFV